MNKDTQPQGSDPQSSTERPATGSSEDVHDVSNDATSGPKRFRTDEPDSVSIDSCSGVQHMVPIEETKMPKCDKEECTVKPKTQKLQKDAHAPSFDQVLTRRINPKLREQVNQLCEKFASLILKVQKKLESIQVPVGDLRSYVINLNAVFGAHQIECCSPAIKEELKNCTTVEDFFSSLRMNRAWNFLNSNLLHSITKKFIFARADSGDSEELSEGETLFLDKLRKDKEDFLEEIRQFKENTKLEEFLHVWSIDFDPGDTEHYEKLRVKLSASWKNFTLADVDNYAGFVADQFLLHWYVHQLTCTDQGCVELEWWMPKALVEYMKQVCQDFKPDLGQADIMQLSVGDEIIFEAMDKVPASKVIKHYAEYYKCSIEHPKDFWGEMAARTLVWDEPFKKDMVMEGCDMTEGKIKFFDGKLNASVNCLDRHVAAQPNKIAIIWEKNVTEGGKPQEERITYSQLLEDTCRIANVLKKYGVKKDDKVVIYMPAMPLAVASMLACARIGAVHNVVFAVLKTDELKQRVVDSKAKVIITADEAVIGRNPFPLKSIVDEAISVMVTESDEGFCEYEQPENEQKVKSSQCIVLVAKRTGKEVPMVDSRDFSLEKEMKRVKSDCTPVSVNSEDPLFIMYTSGSSDSPLGIVHSTAGYLLQVALSHKYVFDYKPGDVFGCMADLGWITGHSYVVYGPLCNGGTSVLFEGTPYHPDCGRYWEMIGRLRINQLYITPSTIRYLMKDKEKLVKKYKDKLTSLKTIATVGEPLNSDARKWYYKNVGLKNCTLLDTWWQTETGAISIVIPHDKYPESSMTFPPKPFFGVEPCIINIETGKELTFEENTDKKSLKLGYLCLKKPLPSMGRSTLPAKMHRSYFNFSIPDNEDVTASLKGKFFTFDKALHTEGGGFKISCRVGDAIRMKDVWLNIPEIEGSMNDCDPRILDASIVRINPSTSKRFSQTISIAESTTAILGTCAFVELASSVDPSEFPELIEKLKKASSKEKLLVPVTAVPRMFIFISDQLMTHSGKLARSIMREIIDLTQKISNLCSTRRKSADEYTKGEFSHLDVHIWYLTKSWKRIPYD